MVAKLCVNYRQNEADGSEESTIRSKVRQKSNHIERRTLSTKVIGSQIIAYVVHNQPSISGVK